MEKREYIKVEDNSDLARDVNSGAVVNVNHSAFENAKRRSLDAQRQRDEIRSATREINSLKCEMHEIKNMLQSLIDK